MKFSAIIFPPQPRAFRGRRWTSIVLRTLHLIGISGVGAAFLFAATPAQWQPYMLLTVVSGMAMMLIEIWSDGIWLIQLRGISTLLKLGLLAMTFIVGLQPAILISVIIIAGLISHAPGKVRYFMLTK